jgi:hypothetical protein
MAKSSLSLECTQETLMKLDLFIPDIHLVIENSVLPRMD